MSCTGTLQNGATVVMYEGAPNYPQPDRFWKIIDDHKVTVFYTAPTAIRAFIKWGDEYPAKHDLGTLRLLGTVGEPINPEAWMWYREVIGHERCPIVDTWWQTETGGDHDLADSGGDCGQAGFGDAAVLRNCAGGGDKRGEPGSGGPGRIAGDPQAVAWDGADDLGRSGAVREAVLVRVAGCYFTGDGARMDEDGYFWLMGRVDDVINVSGHRLGTMEVESALVAHPKVAEAAVVGRPDELKGQAIAAFVTLEGGITPTKEAKDELRAWVAKEIGSLARPDDIRFTEPAAEDASRERLCGGCCGRWRRMGRSRAI